MFIEINHSGNPIQGFAACNKNIKAHYLYNAGHIHLGFTNLRPQSAGEEIVANSNEFSTAFAIDLTALLNLFFQCQLSLSAISGT